MRSISVSHYEKPWGRQVGTTKIFSKPINQSSVGRREPPAPGGDYGTPLDAAVFGAAAAAAPPPEPRSEGRLALPAPALADGVEAPSKVVSAVAAVQLACVIALVDYTGRADGCSLRATLAALQPRRVALIHGAPDATAALAAHVAASLPGLAAPVAAPALGERVDFSAATPSLLVRLDDAAAAAAEARLAPAGDGAYAVARLDGVLRGGVLCGAAADAPPPHHAPALVGDVRFSDLLQACAAAGIPAEFAAGGVLLCGRGVAVRAGEEGELLLEGALGADWYAVRDVLYSRFRLV